MNPSADTISCEGLSKFFRARNHWALRELSFCACEGEVIGLVGSNGAGKSTLLRILGSVVKPSAGRARLRSPVVALLDPTCGFHRRLTGRENIYFAGGMLGMSTRSITRELDNIVAMSGADGWLDWTVEELSAGMRLRLALSVGLHLDGQLFLFDEILGVGDERFRVTCQNQIRRRQQEGKTVVLVSHDLHTLRQLCTRVLWLERGELIEDGPTESVLVAYQNRSLAPL